MLTAGQVGLQTQVDQSAPAPHPDLTVSLVSAEDSLVPLISAATDPGLDTQTLHSLPATVTSAILCTLQTAEATACISARTSMQQVCMNAQGDQIQTAAWLDKQMQHTGGSKLALKEPDLMLVRGIALC